MGVFIKKLELLDEMLILGYTSLTVKKF